MVKKRIKRILCIALLAICLCGCNGRSNTSNVAKNNIENANENYVNVDLFESDNIALKCDSISKDGILFEVKNLSDSELFVMLTLGLDGVSVNLWGDGDEWNVGANETKLCKMNGNLKFTEHASMSLQGMIFKDNVEIESFDICDVELGGKSNPEYTFENGEEQYSSDELTVEYIDADAKGLNFLVDNKRDISITINFESLTVNGKEITAGNASTIPPHTKGIFTLDLLSYNSDYFPDDLQSFNGVMQTTIQDKGIIDRFPVESKTSRDANTVNEEPGAAINDLSRKLPDTKCIYPNCNNYIAPSGLSDYCTEHSSHCKKCNALISRNAALCPACMANSIEEKPDPKIGMTADEVRNSTWGEPSDINKTTTQYSLSEQWVYKYDKSYRYIYFTDGVVTGIQE